MTIIRKIAAPAFAAAFGLGTALSIVPAFASHDRSVEHQDRQDRQDRADRQDRSSHDKGSVDKADKADKSGRDSGADKGSNK